MKIITVGASSAGKTSLLLRLAQGESWDFAAPEPTVGVSNFRVKDGEKVFDFWDTAGSEKSAQLFSNYYRTADVVLLCFDISSMDSYGQLIDTHFGRATDMARPGVHYILVGTKGDLRKPPDEDPGESVAVALAADWANTNNMPYVETSAKSGENVQSLFQMIAALEPLPPDGIGGGGGGGSDGGGGCNC
jgi:small GTP-binding protein